MREREASLPLKPPPKKPLENLSHAAKIQRVLFALI